VAAHLAEFQIEHRIFGRPMQFWNQIAQAADKRYLKSYCFGTNLSSPSPGFSFSDYNTPRGLETFEPCSMGNFAAYGRWFQENKVPWVEPVDVSHVSLEGDRFSISLSNGEHCFADQVVVATGLASFSNVPRALASLQSDRVKHTSEITGFSTFKGRRIAVLGAGQSALEAAVLLHEAGAEPTLLVREHSISWHSRVRQKRSLWRRLRSPITGLGTGPKAWALTRFPRALHRMPDSIRTRFVKTHLPAEGAWWLRERFEGNVPALFGTEVIEARDTSCGVTLTVRNAKDQATREITFDQVIAGSGYIVDVDRLTFLDESLRGKIKRLERSPKLNATFESSVPGLRFVGAASAMSFGPLFRFVVGAEYTARTISKALSQTVSRTASETMSRQIASPAACAE
jgi:thioredoxin reductase